MEIFAKLKSFSFYHKSEAIYVTAEIIDFEKRADYSEEIFRGIETGQTISFVYTGKLLAEYLELLKAPVLFVNTTQRQPAKDPKYPDKFVIQTLRKCDMFKASS